MHALRRTSWTLATIGVVVLLSTLTLATFSGTGSASPAPNTVQTPYTVTFTETGLPNGTSWSVHVAYVGCTCLGVRKTVSSDTSSITIPVTNGTYRYSVLRVEGYFVNVTPKGIFNVSGANVTGISFTFHPVIPFIAEFTESGLPHNTTWSVSVRGNGRGQERALEDQTATSYGTSLNFTLPNGTYHYTVANVPGSFFLNHSYKGKFVIHGASVGPIAVTLTTPRLYSVTYNETGLPLGTNWSVRVHGIASESGAKINQVLSSTTASLSFQLPNGSYSYVVAQVLGFNVASPLSGSFAVSGGSLATNVSFVPVAPGAFYAVAFEETGLANGTHWSVTVVITHTFGHSRKAVQSGNTSSLFFLLPNGTYKFQVHEKRAYILTAGGSGEFTIAGSAPAVNLVTFVAIPRYTTTFNETGLANATSWSVLVRSLTASSTPWLIHAVHVSTSSTITFSLPNGTYCYKIYAVSGYRISSGAATGTFTVAGASPPTFTVGFTLRA
jgi:hypothetical protein